MKTRLQKFLAEAGVASRRACEQLILAGRVSVNGESVTKLGVKIDPATDVIELDGRALRLKKKLYLALHKPRRYVCSRQDELNRRTIYELIPKEWANLYSVGRLDYESEGLIFLTNDGEFSLRLTHPRFGIHKRYVAIVIGRVEGAMLKKFTEGMLHEGEQLKAEKAWLITASKSASTVELELAEGKNREVRRLFESQGLVVERLARTQIGKIKLRELPSGKWRTLTETEIKSLLSPL